MCERVGQSVPRGPVGWWSGLGVDTRHEISARDEGDVAVQKENGVLEWRGRTQVPGRACAVGEQRDYGLGVDDEAWFAEGFEVVRVGTSGETFEVGRSVVAGASDGRVNAFVDGIEDGVAR